MTLLFKFITIAKKFKKDFREKIFNCRFFDFLGYIELIVSVEFINFIRHLLLFYIQKISQILFIF